MQGKDVWVVAPDGLGARNLTRGLRAGASRTEEYDPAISPDGRLVAYLVDNRACDGRSCREVNDLYTSRVDGRGAPRPLTAALSREVKLRPGQRPRGGRRFLEFGAPAWSPDGGRIALQCRIFKHGEEGHHLTDLCVVDSRGRKIRRITGCNCVEHGPGTRPDWSPRGDRIAFSDGRGVWTVAPSGRRLREILDPRDDPAGERLYDHVSWSPDGRLLAFSSARPRGGGASVWVSDAAGGGLLRLLDGGPDASYSRPAWSPDGREIAFHLDSDLRPPGIYRTSAAGTGEQTLVRAIDGSARYLAPAWGRAP